MSTGRKKEQNSDKPLAVALTDHVRGALAFQSYERTESIAGVSLLKLRKHHSENGWFMELFRLQQGNLEGAAGTQFDLRQVSAAFAAPNRINAFHIHPKIPQDEIWTVVLGSLLVCLVDCRDGSPTAGVCQKIVLTGDEPAALTIPAGVAHGYRAGHSGGFLLYGMNQQFDPDDPNEGRLPWDHFGPDLWNEDRG